MWIECQARQSNGRLFPTLASLKRALADDAAKVRIESVGNMHHAPFTGPANVLVNNYPEHKFQITGPDPYVKRSWYATLYVKRDGSIGLR